MKQFFGGEVTEITLLLRMLCGGYLVYLAWDLGQSGLAPDGNMVYLLAAAVFALVGGVVFAFSLRRWLRRDYVFVSTEQSGDEDEEQDDE